MTTGLAKVTERSARVRTSDLRKDFLQADGERLTAVRDVTLDLEPGSATAITGPSGSGKSTLLHLLGGIERADGGRIVVDEHEVTALRGEDLSAYRRTVGFVFQRFHLLAALTAIDNVLAPLVPFKVDFDKAARARELLAAVGLAEKERSIPSRLSGGQQQRVAIARALVNRPRLLLADEPTGNLDSATGTQIVDLLLGLRDVHRMTVLIATHDPHIAARCDRTIHFRDGEPVDVT